MGNAPINLKLNFEASREKDFSSGEVHKLDFLDQQTAAAEFISATACELFAVAVSFTFKRTVRRANAILGAHEFNFTSMFIVRPANAKLARFYVSRLSSNCSRKFIEDFIVLWPRHGRLGCRS